LQVGQSVAIQGPGASVLSISGNQASRVPEILLGADAVISGLTVTDGVVNSPAPPRRWALVAASRSILDQAVDLSAPVGYLRFVHELFQFVLGN
jgi:hypothetical protein